MRFDLIYIIICKILTLTSKSPLKKKYGVMFLNLGKIPLKIKKNRVMLLNVFMIMDKIGNLDVSNNSEM